MSSKTSPVSALAEGKKLEVDKNSVLMDHPVSSIFVFTKINVVVVQKLQAYLVYLPHQVPCASNL